MSSISSPRDSRKLAPIFNRKLFTNFGDSVGRKRARVSEVAIFGQAASDVTAAPRKRPVRVQTTAVATPAPETKFVSLQNYVNLFNLIDGLRHQLPNFGYDLYIPHFARTMFDSYECVSEEFNSGSTSSSTTSSLGSPSFGTQDDVVLADASTFASKRIDWTTLLRTQLLGILRMLSAGYRDDFRPANKNHMAQTFVLNRAAKRWDQLSTAVADYAPDDIDQPKSFQGTIVTGESEVEQASDGKEAVLQQLKKFLVEARSSLVENVERAELIGASSIDSVCLCCQWAPHVLVRSTFSINGVSSDETDPFLRQQFSVPLVTFDVASFLCGSVPAKTFAENYTLRHIMQKENSDLDTELVKTLYVSSLTFYERMYAVHLSLGLLIDWCWTRHRLVHSVLQGSNCTCDSVPPVVVLVNRSLHQLLQRSVALPTLTLSREHKFIYHVI